MFYFIFNISQCVYSPGVWCWRNMHSHMMVCQAVSASARHTLREWHVCMHTRSRVHAHTFCHAYTEVRTCMHMQTHTTYTQMCSHTPHRHILQQRHTPTCIHKHSHTLKHPYTPTCIHERAYCNKPQLFTQQMKCFSVKRNGLTYLSSLGLAAYEQQIFQKEL